MIRTNSLELHNWLKQIAPLYVIGGSDPLFSLQSQQEIINFAQHHGFEDKQEITVDQHFDFTTIYQAVQSVGLFSTKQLLVLNFPENMTASLGAKFTALLSKPLVDCLIIAIFPKLSFTTQKQRWFVDLSAHHQSIFINCETTSVPMNSLIQHCLRKWQLQLVPDAVDFLNFYFENNTQALYQCLYTLSLMGIKRSLRISDIEKIIDNSSQFTPFEFTDALLAGNIERAVRALHRLVNEQTPFLLLLRVIQKELMILLELGASSFRGRLYERFITADFNQKAQELKIWTSKRSGYLQFMQRKTPLDLLNIIAALSNIEIKVKQNFDEQIADLEHLARLFK